VKGVAQNEVFVKDYGDHCSEEDVAINQELADLNESKLCRLQSQENIEDCCCRLVAMASEGKTTTGASPASTASTTPLPQDIAENETEKGEDEERDAFHFEHPSSLPFNRLVPLIHHNHTPPRSLGIMKTPSPNALLLHVHPRLQSGLSSTTYNVPPSTPQLITLPAVPQVISGPDFESESQKMSRSISDSTLRRAALHLNLNQSVLPSFTSIQQFKASIYFKLYPLKIFNFFFV